MASTDDYYKQLEEEAKRQGVTPEASWRDDLSRTYEGHDGGQGARSQEDIFQSIFSQQAGRATNVPGGGSDDTPTQAWNNAGGSIGGGNGGIFPDWYRELMTRQVGQQEADRAENKGRADALYSTLNDRASQGLNVTAQDPIIKNQVDAFGAGQERNRRNYLSDVAEQGGPFQNMRGEQRMTAEKAGQATSGFQAELMGRELQSKRDEIQNSLATQGAMLSGDQTRNLQQQLAQYDQAIAETNATTSRTSVDNQFTLGQQSLELQKLLGLGGLNLQQQGIGQNQDQFLRELALRQWQVGDNSDYQWANLGA